MTERLYRAIDAASEAVEIVNENVGEMLPSDIEKMLYAQALIADLLDGMDGMKDHKEASGYDAAINAIKVRAGLEES